MATRPRSRRSTCLAGSAAGVGRSAGMGGVAEKRRRGSRGSLRGGLSAGRVVERLALGGIFMCLVWTAWITDDLTVEDGGRFGEWEVTAGSDPGRRFGRSCSRRFAPAYLFRGP